MAVAFRTTQSASGDESSPANSFVITKPTGLTAGDKMVAVISWFHTGTINTPAGWAAPQTDQDFNSASAKVFTKTADAGDVAASNFTFTSGTSAAYFGVLLAMANVGSLDVSNVGVVASGSASSSGVTPNEQDFFLAAVAHKSTATSSLSQTTADYAIATSNPSWTELFDSNVITSGANRMGVSIAYATRPELTATGNATATVSVDGANVTLGTALFLLGFVETKIVTLDVVSAPATAQDFASVTGGMTTTLGVVSATTIANDMTGGKADWSYETKPTTTWDYTDK